MQKTNNVVIIGVLSAAAVILKYLGSYMGLKVGGFLDVELSDYPAILGALAIGPLAGVAIEFIKNVLHLAISHTGFVGELANFLMMGVYVFVTGLIYKCNKTKKGARTALAAGVLALCAAGIIFNAYITLPAFMPGVPMHERLFKWILPVITPFNFVKGIVLGFLTMFTYKPLSPVLHK